LAFKCQNPLLTLRPSIGRFYRMSNIKATWKAAFTQPLFKKLLYVGATLTTLVLIFFQYFFAIIEKRDGFVMNDCLLHVLPAVNVSYLIFAIIWTTTIYTLIRCLQHPMICLTLIWSFLILCIARIASISLVPFNPPQQLVPLIDPITNIFYGGTFITKDLFFSGHTSTQFIFSLCLIHSKEKWIMYISTVAVGILVLLQHVHYSVDVLAAPFFAWLCFIVAKKITHHASH